MWLTDDRLQLRSLKSICRATAGQPRLKLQLNSKLQLELLWFVRGFNFTVTLNGNFAITFKSDLWDKLGWTLVRNFCVNARGTHTQDIPFINEQESTKAIWKRKQEKMKPSARNNLSPWEILRLNYSKGWSSHESVNDNKSIARNVFSLLLYSTRRLYKCSYCKSISGGVWGRFVLITSIARPVQK